jgi:hypothetical protein
MGEDASGGFDVISACLSYSDGGVLYYSTTLPARTALTATATPSGNWDPSIRLLDSCGAAMCLSSADDGYTGDPETLTYRNKSMSAQPVLIAVGGTAGSAGLFDLSIDEAALGPPPTNTTCAMATALSDGTTLTSQDASDGVDDLSAACESGATSGVLYYSATIPANNRLKVHVQASTGSMIDAVVRVLSACGAATCLSSSDASYGTGDETLLYKNTTASATPVIVAVGGYSDTSTGPFDLDAHILPNPPTPTNLTCATAKSVTNGTSLADEDGSVATASANGYCLSSATGKALFYSVTIPAGKTLTATVTPLTSWDPTIRLIQTCAGATCATSADTGYSGDPETLTYTNSTASSVSMILAVGGYGTSGEFSMTVTLQ